mmetsp:Transcript_31981/g.71875  ORF Transcript_31981/g.71875 Transcript_31981/m.71875 type:complete len:104 (+) Transcript_31981:59-370(+)
MAVAMLRNRAQLPALTGYSARRTAVSRTEQAPAWLGWAKVGGGLTAAGLLLIFHYMILTQREQQDKMYREKIQTLTDEVLILKTHLREVERARFKGKPQPTTE